MIRIENLVSDSIGYFPRIKSDQIGSIFDRLSSNELQNVFRISSEWFTLAQIQISDWIGIVLIGSEWIPIRYFRQGIYFGLGSTTWFIFKAEIPKRNYAIQNNTVLWLVNSFPKTLFILRAVSDALVPQRNFQIYTERNDWDLSAIWI